MLDEQLKQARISLEGLSVGDAFGESFFRKPRHVVSESIASRTLPSSPWHWSDDTAMALSIYESLRDEGSIHPDRLALKFAARYNAEPGRGYGPGARRVLSSIYEGTPWGKAAKDAFGGQGSMGNGSAMRVGPIGAFHGIRVDPAEASKQMYDLYRDVTYSAAPTHAHPEGHAGAVAVAFAAFYVSIARGVEGKPLDPRTNILESVHQDTPVGETKSRILTAARLPLATPIDEAVRILGNGSRVTAPDTVPFAIWCASRHLDNFEEAMWQTVSAGGDRDTNCAIVGSIVSCSVGLEGIPDKWLKRREPLPL